MTSMFIQNPQAVAGIGSAMSASRRRVIRGGSEDWMPSSFLIKGSASRDPLNTGNEGTLRPGLLMGKQTSGGLYAPSIMGLSTVAYTSGGTELTVSVATATELVRRVGASGVAKLHAPPSAAGTVAALTVTYSAVVVATGVITTASLGANAVAGGLLTANDGSDFPLTVIPDGYGLNVLDSAGASINIEFPLMPCGGILDSSQIINWPTDTSLQAWIASYMSAASAGKFAFDHAFGG